MSQLKPITCRAAVMYEEGKPLVIENVLVDVPNADQVRIKMVSAGICASDAHFVRGQQKVAEQAQKLPTVLGHEGAGIVESVGVNVTHLKPGDHVLTTFVPICNNCAFCASPLTNLCMNIPFGANKKLSNGDDLYGINGLGVYSEYILLKSSQAIKIDTRANLNNACIISCAVATGFYAAINQANVLPGTTAAIWGVGAIGLNAVFGCKFAGAKNIIGIDLNSDKKEVALEFGCTEFINPKDLDKPVEQYLMAKYGGVDYAFDCIGAQAVLDTALKSLSTYGTLAIVGVPTTGTEIKYPAGQMLTGKKIIGGIMGNKPVDQAYDQLLDMYLAGEYGVDRLVTNRFNLDNINDAFQTLR